MAAHDVLGLPVPDEGTVFLAVLTVHVASGLAAIVSGALAATARKRPGRHPRSGRVYLWALGGIFVTATVMAAIRWPEDAHLFAIGAVAFGLGLYGYLARRQRRPGWPPHHAIGMGGSYIALLTGFYVDNGPFLPVWDRLPHIAYWTLPALVGTPLIWIALHRFGVADQTSSRADPPAGTTPHELRQLPHDHGGRDRGLGNPPH